MPADIHDFNVDASVPEMHDRMIAGVARRLNAPLITRDGQLQELTTITTIW
jgi:predicted nucleic acid-binding protein